MKWYRYDIRDLNKTEYEKWYSLMNRDKQKRVDRFRFMDDKKRSVAGEMLARKAVAEWCDVVEEDIRFDTTAYGKPFATGLGVEFNISHSGNMVVCAVDDKPVGIDIERIRPVDLSIAKYICTVDELGYIFGYEPSERDFIKTEDAAILTRFFEVWTSKEAYGKCRGVGIADIFELNILKSNIQRRMFGISDYMVSIYQEL